MEPLLQQSPLEAAQEEIKAITLEAAALVIRTDRDFEAAGKLAGRIKKCTKTISDLLGPEVKQKHADWKAAVSFRDGYLDPLAAHEKAVKDKMAAFHEAREALRLKLESEARNNAVRLAQEEAAWKAEQMWERGAETEALDLLDNPAPVVSASIASLTPKAEGASFPVTWTWEVEDMSVLVTAAAQDPTLLAVLAIDSKAMNKLADALRERAKIPGVRVFPRTGVAIRS